MADQIAKGTWVQIHNIVLSQGERAPQVPQDTQRVPLEMTVKGFLVEPACVGEEAVILTHVGRQVRGTLTEVNPAYTHSFGPPIPELTSVGGEVRAMLCEQRRES
jgi:hypothetical protein